MATKPVKNPIKDACASQKPPIKHLYSTPDPFTHFAPGQTAWPPHGPSWHEVGLPCRSCGKRETRSIWGSCSNALPHPCPKGLAKDLFESLASTTSHRIALPAQESSLFSSWAFQESKRRCCGFSFLQELEMLEMQLMLQNMHAPAPIPKSHQGLEEAMGSPPDKI